MYTAQAGLSRGKAGVLRMMEDRKGSYSGRSLPPRKRKKSRQPDTQGECLPGARPAHARRATFVVSILSLAPSLSPPREVPQVDCNRPQTFRAKHAA